ncbi:glycine--tRNA ligase subunit beta [Fervidobacterium nodosum]|uniref:Glycine--tRNA ligase beta subunit n=1 Tax=Fervidobacterium nodosum (strain ATCC 35602 / DSM 5306 / Rt17-B1) TaxID=381764 RepID=A7HLX0_FERNB|nr:glycine--tRNA ligase subunit beta [Fervidobacterium nodosum]ABS60903.1 glycyl-tRNA synthetase, beta subunit [Fervidobacterium nodosum Rt17-B1]
MSKPNEFLFELGIEELPTTEINGLIQQLSDKIQNTLSVEGINYEKFQIFVAPRRFGFVIEGLPDNTPEKVIEKKGPAANIAFDENNQPTKALLGFLKSNNSTLEEVKIIDNYVYITKTQKGLPIEEFLKTTVPSIITSIKFRKPMKWADGKYEFVRIPHHVLALLNGKIVEMEIFEIKSSNKTVGHRFVMDEYFEVNSVQDYFDKLSKYYVIPKLEDRIKFIKSQLEEFEKNGYTIDKDEELIQEVAILTEYPKLISGTFLEKYLTLPEELIKTTIKHHQRSFTVHSGNKITNTFVAFIDMPMDELGNAKKGYERVINARLEDAKYYYEKDIHFKLESFNEKLKEIVFQKELGTLYDKISRIEQLSKKIIEILELEKISDNILRTAKLCKADIGTHVVYEFPELQGIMGRIYALKDGEAENIAYGIEEHYSSNPSTVEGAVVGIADRIDTIVGNFIIGNIPSGSKDPYGLRSKTDDIFAIIEKFSWDLDLKVLLEKAAELLGKELPTTLIEFFENRFELYNSNVRYDIARAVKHLWKKPLRGILSAKAIYKLVGKEEFEHLLVGFERVHNISKKHISEHFDSAKFVEESEKKLFQKYIEVKPFVLDAIKHLDFESALEKLIELRPYIDEYFDKVFVMCEDEDLRMNRLGFLKNIDMLFMEIGDLTLIEHSQN